MQEKHLVQISLIVAVLGLVFLFFYAGEIDIPSTPSLEDKKTDENVRIEGLISRLTVKEKAVFLTVEGQQTESMSIIFFPDEEPFLKEGDYVEVSGKVEEYQGKKEVIAESVIVK